MLKYAVDGVIVKVENGFIPEEEAMAYVQRGKKLHGKGLREITAILDPNDSDMIDLHYQLDEPFQRLRRITGYLVGTLGRWNNAKRAEEHDRVKHGTKE